MNRAYREYCRLVAASCISFAPPYGQGSLIPPRLLSPTNPLRWASMGAPIPDTVQMFPERFQEKPPHLYSHAGGATAFRHHGVVTKPERTIGIEPMNQIGVMADGMAYPY